jgi:serine/threonine-protein kinase RsbW
MDQRTRTFASTPDATAEASSFVMETAEAFGVGDTVQEALLLAVGEAVANAAKHGNQLDPTKKVAVECTKRDSHFYLCVEDSGEGVPPERLEHAALPEDPLQTSGRGLFIMKSLADRIWLEESGRRLCLMWQLSNDDSDD